ncbi:MAG: hypothetical protein A2654_00265 [Candidatus Nealsonbacteria bacterium RIFCSPHIGHO2_01_FULL_43_31]|uniref:TrbC/VIRB2 family protein n=2 Tax=Candidatus Nealsoniibacteriota TaxID=1817911 RepID=A0A1G2E3S5_9BACT|nr:MAG: hypothetical protein A2654_00265 [Candidatus Nealsonbacteria bacterium RIFCSPHIGHO2_01_FULL_43_31]OGZ25411.1 MAG: hypothetical protein A2922_00510 [Candidatus Nealsonbacteria bacterium RIFCSPLOWO2_01_FULL_43_36]
MKKIILAVFLFLFLAAAQAQAAGLVPCGGAGEESCSFCDFFKLISNVFNLAIKIAITIATLMLVIGGGMLLFAGADPGMLTKAKSLIKSTVIGLIVIFTAFMVVGVILNAIGLATWSANFYKDWMKGNFFQIPGC